MASVAAIKVTGLNHSDVDSYCTGVKTVSEQTGVKMRGPIPFPTRRLTVPCRKSPDGEGAETWDHWEMRVHKRLIELEIKGAKDEAVLSHIVGIGFPDTVHIEITLRTVT